MRKIAAVATCTALTVVLSACGGASEETTNALSSQQAQIVKAKATLADQRTALETDQTALAEHKANAVADIKKTRDTLSTQASALRGTVGDLRSRVHGLRASVKSEKATLRKLQGQASGVR